MTTQEYRGLQEKHDLICDKFKSLRWLSPSKYLDRGDWAIVYLDPYLVNLSEFIGYPYCGLNRIVRGDQVEIELWVYWDLVNYVGYPDKEQFSDWDIPF